MRPVGAQSGHGSVRARRVGRMLQRAGSGRPIGLRWLHRLAAELGEQELWNRVGRLAHCEQSSLGADEWFPVSPDPDTARRQAAQAIAVCAACPVRADCHELSPRHRQIGQYGIWGGPLPAERAAAETASSGQRLDESGLPPAPAEPRRLQRLISLTVATPSASAPLIGTGTRTTIMREPCVTLTARCERRNR
jgi:hypothetical protein